MGGSVTFKEVEIGNMRLAGIESADSAPFGDKSTTTPLSSLRR